MVKIFSYVVILSVIITNLSCKKTVEKLTEQKQEDLVILAMTNGSWKMTWFKENGANISDFDGYEFKYYANYTVDGIAPGGITKTGNWGGSSATMTTSCDFAATAGTPLTKLNGTWKIVRNSWTYVEAEQVVGSLTKTMRLDKK